jgi:hypothetical protein
MKKCRIEWVRKASCVSLFPTKNTLNRLKQIKNREPFICDSKDKALVSEGRQ